MNDRQHQLNIEKKRWADKRDAQLSEFNANPLHQDVHQHPGKPGEPAAGVNPEFQRFGVPKQDQYGQTTSGYDISSKVDINVGERGLGRPTALRKSGGGDPERRDLARAHPFSVSEWGATLSFEVAGPIGMPFDPKNRRGYEIRIFMDDQFDRFDWGFMEEVKGHTGGPAGWAAARVKSRLGMTQDKAERALSAQHSQAVGLDSELARQGQNVNNQSYKPDGDLI